MTECFHSAGNREDEALYFTMKAIRDRLKFNLVVDHPCTPNETITSGTDDARARFLKEKLTDAIDALAPTFESDCTQKDALKAWDKVFSTTFFSDRLPVEKAAAISRPAILSSGLLREGAAAAAAREAVRKEGGGRYA